MFITRGMVAAVISWASSRLCPFLWARTFTGGCVPPKLLAPGDCVCPEPSLLRCPRRSSRRRRVTPAASVLRSV